jgi:Tol biopolymer transport system component
MNVFLYDRTNGTTTLVSVNTNGAGGGNGDSFAVAISTNGQFALFESAATNLVAGDSNGVNDIFVRDVSNGVTTLISVSAGGGSGNGVSRNSTMTPDGRYVAFVSSATNLVAGDTNGLPDIFVRDLQLSNTILVSVGAEYAESAPTNSSEAPDISDDGRYVVFSSTATNLVPGVATTQEIYVRDLVGGVTIWVSANSQTITQSMYGLTNEISSDYVISADGQYVAYVAGVTNIGSWNPSGALIRYHVLTGATDIVSTNAVGATAGYGLESRTLDMTPDGNFIAFVTNQMVGLSASAPPDALMVWNAQSNTTTQVSSSSSSNSSVNPDYFWPQLSDDGRYVAFFTSVSNLTADPTISGIHLYVYDSVATSFSLVDPRTNGTTPAYFPPNPPSLTSNGQIIAFESFDPSLAANDANCAYDVFVCNVTNSTLELISTAAPVLPSVTPVGQSLISAFSVSANARYIAFVSAADDLVTNDANFYRDVFVHDLLTGSNTLVSVATNGYSGNYPSSDSAISSNGQYVAFTSSASNLVANDTNFARDVFLRDLIGGTTTLISVNTNGTGPGNADSFSPIISANGRYILFRSLATNLAPGIPSNSYSSGFNSSGGESLFRRDTQLGTTFALFTNKTYSGLVVATSPDGRFVAYGGVGLTNYVWDMQTTNRIYTNSSSVEALAISADGTKLAYASNSQTTSANFQVFYVNITSNTIVALGNGANTSQPGLQFSANGQYLVFNSGGSGPNQVVLFNTQTGATNLVSRAYNSSLGGNGSSDFATISPNGQYVAYRSLASNLVPNDFNGVADVFLYNQSSGETTLMSVSQYGSFSANNHSFAPVFSADSQTLLLTSWASDLVSQDFNQSGDVFGFSLYDSNSEPSLIITIIAPGTVTWPAVAGKNYQVQFKNNLTDASWQIVNGNVSVVGGQAYLTDLAPAPTQKFYRVMAY